MSSALPPGVLALVIIGLAWGGIALAEQGMTVDLEPESTKRVLAPGNEVTLWLNLTNAGPTEQTYGVALSWLGPAWIRNLTGTQVTLPGMSSKAIPLIVRVPPGPLRRDVVAASIIAENVQVAADRDQVEVFLYAQAEDPPPVDISVVGLASGEPGATVRLPTRVRNHGSLTEMVRFEKRPLAGWAFSVEPADVTLAPHSALSTTLEVTVPTSSPRGTSVELPFDVRVDGYGPTALNASIPFQVAAPASVKGTPPLQPTAAPQSGHPVPANQFTPTVGWITSGAAVAVLGLVALESVRFRLALAAWSLFSRVEKDQALGHGRRQQILEAVRTTPGIHYGALRRLLEVSNGTLAHHLRILELHGLLRARNDGFRRRYYGRDDAIETNTWLTDAERRVHGLVVSRPGLIQRELARELGLSRQVASYYVIRLARRGHLHVEGSRRTRRLYPGPPPTGPIT